MNSEEVVKIFNENYPATLQDIISSEVHSVKNVFSMAFVKSTQIVRYDKRYDAYLKTVKYFPLKSDDRSELFKVGLLDFFKLDPIARTEVRFSLFKLNKDVGLNTMKRLSKLNTPLKVDFALKLPLEYMQLLENSFGREILPIQYESSMSTIFDNGITYEDFKTSEWENVADDANAEATKKLEDHHNSIAAYKVRIAEANRILLQSIQLLLESKDEETNTASIFSILPSIYSASAVITVSSEHLKLSTSHPDPIISSLFNVIATTIANIANDLKKAKD